HLAQETPANLVFQDIGRDLGHWFLPDLRKERQSRRQRQKFASLHGHLRLSIDTAAAPWNYSVRNGIAGSMRIARTAATRQAMRPATASADAAAAGGLGSSAETPYSSVASRCPGNATPARPIARRAATGRNPARVTSRSTSAFEAPGASRTLISPVRWPTRQA